MSSFPLYDSLIVDVSNDELKIEEKDDFMKMIKTFDTNGYELIYALIRVFQLENNEDKSTFKLPYGGKYVKNDILFDLNEFPNKLKQLLYKFVKIHHNEALNQKK